MLGIHDFYGKWDKQTSRGHNAHLKATNLMPDSNTIMWEVKQVKSFDD